MSRANNDVIEAVKSDMGDMASIDVIEIVVDAAADISRRFVEKAAVKKSHDLLFAALAPELVLGSMLSRSATSLMGSQFYPRLAIGLARLRYGEKAVPRILISPSVKEAGLTVSRTEEPPGHDVYIYTAYDQSGVNDEANRIQKLIKADRRLKIGTPGFDQVFSEALDRISKKPYATRVWESQNDFAVIPGIGLIEMESGGQLDSSNVQSQVQKLIRGGLALGRIDVRLYWSLAYANRGEGVAPTTALAQYLTYSVKEPGRLLALGVI